MLSIQLLGSTMGLALVSGLNLYATVLSVGLGIRLGLIHLSPDLVGLSILAHPYVLIVAGIVYIVEFIADKIPWVDSLWDSAHTFIRPLGAAILGATAIGYLDPAVELSVFLLCGGVALSTHSTKAGARLFANHSPEPFSNVGLSLVEDGVVIGGTWLALKHPVLMLVLVAVFIAVFLLLAPRVFRLLRVEILALAGLIRRVFGRRGHAVSLFDPVPDRYRAHIPEDADFRQDGFCVRCVSGKGVEIGRHFPGFLILAGKSLLFLTEKRFRIRKIEVDLSGMDGVILERRLLFYLLILRLPSRKIYFQMFKNQQQQAEEAVEILSKKIGSPQHP